MSFARLAGFFACAGGADVGGLSLPSLGSLLLVGVVAVAAIAIAPLFGAVRRTVIRPIIDGIGAAAGYVAQVIRSPLRVVSRRGGHCQYRTDTRWHRSAGGRDDRGPVGIRPRRTDCDLRRLDVPTRHLLAPDRAGVGNVCLDGTTGRDLSAPSSERSEFRTKQALSFSGDLSAH